MEQCVFCHDVYELEDSNSTLPSALCTDICERGYENQQKELEEELDR